MCPRSSSSSSQSRTSRAAGAGAVATSAGRTGALSAGRSATTESRATPPRKTATVTPPEAVLRALETGRGDVTDLLGPAPWPWQGLFAKAYGGRPEVLALDPGAVTGWARLGRAGYSGGQLSWDVGKVAELLEDFGRSTRGVQRLLVVEDAFVAHNWVSAFTLCRRVGGVLWAAERLEVPTVRVMASSWQSKLLVSAGGRRNREQGKAQSLLVARQTVSGAITTDHAADAALLAVWARGGAGR